MPILTSKVLFVCEKLLDEKIFSSFSRKFGYLLSKKDLEIKSDPFRSDPWFFGSTIRSRSSRRKWIYDPITILKKVDLDPKGSRSDHDCHISAYCVYQLNIQISKNGGNLIKNHGICHFFMQINGRICVLPMKK